jgi:HEAT repeat protein
VALLALADELPEVDELEPFLTDPAAEVRRTALNVLSESVEDWVDGSPWIARSLLDPDAGVRAVGIDLLAELREVLVADGEFTGVLEQAAGHPEPDVRAAALGALWRHHRLGSRDAAERHLADPEPAVRAEAVLGLVSLAALDGLARAAADSDAGVRAAVARGLGTLADLDGAPVLVQLAGDPERPVVIAALTALGSTGCPNGAVALATNALRDPYWQVREAGAIGLGGAEPDLIVGPLLAAAGDDNIDVRKAAVRVLGERAPGHPDVPAALRRAAEDPDADVRAYARMALDRASVPTGER